MRVSWTEPACAALEGIVDHIAKDNPGAAYEVARKIRDAVQLLADMPHIGRPGRLPGTRELVVASTPFIVPYRTKSEVVEVLAVFHGARRWPEHF